MQHGGRRAFPLADLKHAGKNGVAARTVRAGLELVGQGVHLGIGPLAVFLLLAIGAVLADNGRYRSLNGAELDQSRMAREGMRSSTWVQFSLLPISGTPGVSFDKPRQQAGARRAAGHRSVT